MWSGAQAVEALQRGASNEPLVCVAGYVLGEYGKLLTDVPIHSQFSLLQERFVSVSPEAKACASALLLMLLLAACNRDYVWGFNTGIRLCCGSALKK